MTRAQLVQWLGQQGYRARAAGDGDEVETRCPRCRRQKLYANPVKQRFICFRCGFAGTLVHALMEIGGLSDKQAEQLAGTQEVVRQPLRFRATPACPLPLGFERITPETDNRYTRYWEGRRFDRDLACAYGVGYCDYGPYGGRLVVPVVVERRLVHWVARDVLGRAGPKVMTPSGNHQAEVLFNLDVARHAEEVVVTEGVFDALRLPDRSVASFGKRLSQAQRALLLRCGVRRLCFAWDDDARYEALRTAQQVQGVFTVRVARLPGKDPADLSAAAVEEAIRAARPPRDGDLLLATIAGL